MSWLDLHRSFCVLIITCLFPFTVAADELDDLVVESKKLINIYTLQLQTEYENVYALVDFNAVREVCKKTAIKIANDLAKDGWSIRRISLDPLNKDNSPDQAENRILQDFIAKQTEGKPTDQLAWYKLSEIANQSEFRYIRAFTMEQRCMTCHKDQSGSQTGLAAYSIKKIETKNYFSDPVQQDQNVTLPAFEE